MSGAHIRANEAKKTIETVGQPARELSRQQEQGLVQAVAPQVAYRRVQLNRNGLRPADLLALQRAVGNRRVQRMVGKANDEQQDETTEEDSERTVQTKPTVGAPKDVYEQETDRVAGRVLAMPAAAAQRPNRTGLPDGLKSGVESLSGMSMDNVNVHYDSARPVELNALAYTQGNDIHVAPGQEQHLPHEAWHVVQQGQGRVQPRVQVEDGVPINDDQGLEREADVMGARAAAGGPASQARGRPQANAAGAIRLTARATPAQREPDAVNCPWAPSALRRRPIQRYVRMGQDLRVADDGAMAVADSTHRMWATREIIDGSTKVLKSQGSPFRLLEGKQTLEVPALAARRRFRPQVLNEVVPHNTRNETRGDAMLTLEGCSAHGMEMMGAEGALATGMSVVSKGHHGEEEQRYDKRGAQGTGRADTSIMGDVRGEVTETERDQAEADFGEMSNWKRTRRAKKFGINQFAEPEVGEGLAVYTAVEKLRWKDPQDPNKRGWDMHFAPVVAKSGGDYVTLENVAKGGSGDQARASNAWYFKMYGPVKKGEDQSFFGEHAPVTAGETGTMVLRHRRVAGYSEPEVMTRARELKAVIEGAFESRREFEDLKPLFGRWNELRNRLQEADKQLMRQWINGDKAPSLKEEQASSLQQTVDVLEAMVHVKAIHRPEALRLKGNLMGRD